MRSRRLAAHHIFLNGKEIMGLGVIVLLGNNVIEWYKLQNEQPFVEWVGGSIDIRLTEQGLRAFKDGLILGEL